MLVKGICRTAVLSAGTLLITAALGLGTPTTATELKLSYFMSPKHPMNAAVFTPFAERLAEVSGGELTVKLFAGGTLNAAPPQQYSRLLEGVADISFGLPGYTGQLFPVTNSVVIPGMATSAANGTERLLSAIDLIEPEYDAKVLAIWANETKVLITKDKPVRSIDDVQGMTIRVTSAQDVPYVEAWGASAVAQPVNVIHQNLSNGTIDAIQIGSSAIGSFKLWEPAKYITTNIPPSVSAFFLLMNREVWDEMTPEQQAWIEEASGPTLSRAGGEGYDAAGAAGLKVAADNGVEMIELSAAEVQRFQDAMAPVIEDYAGQTIRDDGVTGAQVIEAMGGLSQ